MNEQHEDERLLRDALRAVAEDDELLGASSQVRDRLLAEVHAIARPRWNRMRMPLGRMVSFSSFTLA